jgi:hypothetical protein
VLLRPRREVEHAEHMVVRDLLLEQIDQFADPEVLTQLV